MSRFKGVILTFFELGKTTQPFVLSQGMKLFLSAGEQFMGIGLMANVPHQFILRGVKNVVQGQGQFHHTKARCQVATGFRGRPDDGLSQITANLVEVLDGKRTKVSRGMDILQPGAATLVTVCCQNSLLAGES